MPTGFFFDFFENFVNWCKQAKASDQSTTPSAFQDWTFVDVMAKVSLGDDLWTLSTILLQAWKKIPLGYSTRYYSRQAGLSRLAQGLLKKWTQHFKQFYILKSQLGVGGAVLGRGDLGRTPGLGELFGPWPIMISKGSHQDPYNVGSNFILKPVEVSHWIAPTCPFLTDYSDLRIRHDTEFALQM